jgi:Mn-dependent DtxR family transcriptional regulator
MLNLHVLHVIVRLSRRGSAVDLNALSLRASGSDATLRAAVRALEAEGLVVRDLRGDARPTLSGLAVAVACAAARREREALRTRTRTRTQDSPNASPTSGDRDKPASSRKRRAA